MKNEIERKFLIKKLPDLKNINSVIYNRHYIYRDTKSEMRIQMKKSIAGNIYELERKEIINNFKAEKTKLIISQGEFEKLREIGSEIISREGFFLSLNPNISIKIYHGRFEGLKKVEVEFSGENEAKSFEIPEWFGKEITDSILSRDSKLLDLSDEEFKNILDSLL